MDKQMRGSGGEQYLPPLQIECYGLTDVGKKREKNEDSLLVDEPLGLFMVADGMGGHQGGEYASRLAVKTVKETLHRLMEDPESTIAGEVPFDRTHPGELLRHAIRRASHEIYEEACKNASLRGMGTTGVALLIRDRKGFVAHVGDSRAYLIRDHKIRQLTGDHSLVAEQLRAGFITEEEFKKHKFKNIITRSVGFQSDVEVDLQVRDLGKGDTFLLCSDGLTNLVEDDEILKIVSRENPKTACRKLIDFANKNGGDDNVTVVVAAVLENA